jgi:hypothetical protein
MATSPVAKNGATTIVNVAFDLEKETKGTVRYTERGHAPLIGTLYIRKNAFETADYPKVLQVTVTVGK